MLKGKHSHLNPDDLCCRCNPSNKSSAPQHGQSPRRLLTRGCYAKLSGGCCRCIPRVLFIRHHTDPQHPAAEDVLSVVAPSVFFIPFHPSLPPPPHVRTRTVSPATWGCEGGGGFLRERWMGGGNSDGRYCNRCFISLGGERKIFIAEDSAV
ncbi:hypothetical protein CDAR_556071 [Caerostris darwini]|uniref:Uncharacterized protein n=1 Tax=Caerostris darwini TaxID=1538125 RepID=A0AAV4UV82_9ARAC|nr:hypothetical protein CDAR_556071 [Caerostris darwini]